MSQEQIDSMIAYYTRQRIAGKISDYQFDSMIEIIRQELLHQQQQIVNEDDIDVTEQDVEEYIARENDLSRW